MIHDDDNCAEIENSLPLYVGGDLEEPLARAVALHLEHCAECRERERAARSARTLLASALALSERKGPELWPGVRAGLEREGLLVGEVAAASRASGPPARPLGRRSRLVPLAAAVAAGLFGIWMLRGAFETSGPHGPKGDRGAPSPVLVENLAPTPAQPIVLHTGPEPVPAALRRLTPNERPLREGAEVFDNGLPLEGALGGLDDAGMVPVIDAGRRPH